jgi:4-hydroxy-tetrahydrodipicolinate synthase
MQMIDIRGCGTALVTPFRGDGRVDLSGFSKHIEWQIKSGIDFLVPCGTTGESVTLDEKEYAEVIRTCVRSAAGTVPVVAGAGTNDTRHAVQLSRIAQDEGADALLSVTPYYNKPTQEGLYRHFKEIATSVRVPVVLYNVPGRTGSNLLPETLLRLSQIDNITAVKEASGNLAQIMAIIAGHRAGFRVLSGDDAMAFPMMALGADGLISVVSNIIPSEMAEMIGLARHGRVSEAREIHYRFLDLMNLSFLESNPIPVKYALYRMGRIEEQYRLPLCPMADANKRKLDLELQRLELVTARV